MNEYGIPAEKGKQITISLERPVTESDIGRVRQWLDMFQDSLTESKPKEPRYLNPNGD